MMHSLFCITTHLHLFGSFCRAFKVHQKFYGQVNGKLRSLKLDQQDPFAATRDFGAVSVLIDVIWQSTHKKSPGIKAITKNLGEAPSRGSLLADCNLCCTKRASLIKVASQDLRVNTK